MAWQRVLEAYLVQALLRTPAFHRAVEKIAKNVHRIRHGIPPEEMGGTRIDDPTKSSNSFLKHFSEEVQTQLGRAEGKSASESVAKTEAKAPGAGAKEVGVEDESADAVWKTARKNVEDGQRKEQQGGFMGEYVAALREQLRGGK